MSNLTIASLPGIKPTALRDLLLSPKTASTVAVVDVRDADYLGGHITTHTHAPSSTHPHALTELARTLQSKNTVVFHCMLSQQRGPSAALKYARERERVLKDTEGGGMVLVDGDDEMQGEELEEGKQKVCVLEGGFEGWVRAGFGTDERVTEGFRKELWEGELD